MLLIADSGSTKTDWKVVDENKNIQSLQTIGFNPYLQSGDEIYTTVAASFTATSYPLEKIVQLYFYGAGCSNDEKRSIVKEALHKVFPNASIEVEHDLLAAARALCGKKEGVAAILGTGSNSCFYNGNEITEHVESIGFYLGDEGSGCYMGKKLIQAFIYKELPKELEEDFWIQYGLDKDAILKTVYQQAFPNRFLASFNLFLARHQKHPFVRNIIASSFDDFFKHHISKYSKHKQVPMHSTGSIGFHYQDALQEVASQYGVKMGKNIKSPIEGLLEYHL